MTEELTFDLTPIEILVTVGEEKYTLREASGETAGKYQDAIIRCMKPGLDGKPTSISGSLSAVEPMLISLCLFNSENKNVPRDVIKKWPSRVQKALFQKVKEISELDEKEGDDDPIKNE